MDARTKTALSWSRRGVGPGAALWFAGGIALAPTAARAQCTPVWSAPAGGVFGHNGALGAGVDAMAVGDLDGPGGEPPALYVGGGFISPGSSAAALWDGWAWRALGAGITLDPLPGVQAACVVPPDAAGGEPPGAYFGGEILEAGGQETEGLVLWDGQRWRSARSWHCAGNAHQVWDLVHASGPPWAVGSTTLLVAGRFALAAPASAQHLACSWGPEWTGFGAVFETEPPGAAVLRSVAVFDDDGPGQRLPALYLGGHFDTVMGLGLRQVVRFDGTTHEPLGTGLELSDSVKVLAVFDEDALGPVPPALFVGGSFNHLTVPTAKRLTRWDGQRWSAVGGGVNSGAVNALCVFDEDGDGPGRPCLYAGGSFPTAGGIPVDRFAKWDGQQWHSIGGVAGWGQATWVYALAAFDEDGPGPNPGGLYVGGFFTHVGGIPSNAIARWGCPLAPKCYANCNGDTTATGAARLDVSDYICFQTKFALNHAYADCDQNQLLDINDYICFQTRFALGCS